MKVLKVKEIADIYLGASFRSQVRASARGNIKVIQMKDLKGGYRIDAKNALHAVHIEGTDKLKERHKLEVGDILFRSRGLSTTARLLTEKNEPIIVSAPIFIIRIKSELVIPRYLIWWFNQPVSQAYFRSHSDGALIRMVSRRTLENLQVSLPSIDRQEKIADFYDLAMREQTLLSVIRMKRRRYTHGIMRRMASDSASRKDIEY